MGIVSRIRSTITKVIGRVPGASTVNVAVKTISSSLPGGTSSAGTSTGGTSSAGTSTGGIFTGGSSGGGTGGTGGIFTGGTGGTPSGGYGYSYVDTATGKGYEVSPTGVKKEIIIPPPRITQQSLREQEYKRVAGAKTFEEKTRISGEIVEARKVALEKTRISAEQQRILSSGGATTTKVYKDVDTGHQVEHTTVTGKGGTRVFTTKDLVTGETKVRTYATPKGGGGARQTGGLYFTESIPVKVEGIPVKEITRTPLPSTIIRSQSIFFTPSDARKQLERIYEDIKDSTSKKVTLGDIGVATGKVALWVDVQAEKISKLPIIKDIRESKVITKIKEFGKKTDVYLESGRITEEEQGWLSPSGVKRGFDIAAGVTIKAGEVTGEITKPILIRAGVSEESWLFKPAPIKTSTVRDIISTAYMFTAFSPFMKTGTAQMLESQYADDVIEVVYKGKVVKMTTTQAKSLGLSSMTTTQAKTAFGSASVQRQEEILKLTFKNKFYLDQQSLLKDINLAKDFMRSSGLTQSQIERHILKLFPGQSSTIVTTQTTGGIITTAVKPLATQTFGGTIMTTTPATMEGVGLIGAGVSSGSRFDIFSKTISPAQEAWSEQQQKSISFQAYKGIQDTKQDQQQIQLLKSATALRQRQDTKQVQKQEVKQIQLLKQDTKQDSMLKSLLVNLQIGKQTLLQKQVPKQPQPFKPTTTPIKPTPTKPIPISLGSALSQVKKVIAKDEGMFEAIGVRFGKEISLLKGTKEEVTKGLSGFLSGTLGASGLIKEIKTGRKLTSEETGLLRNISFRKSKVDPFKVVEKRSKRLKKGTREVPEIMSFKRGKKSLKRKKSFNI